MRPFLFHIRPRISSRFHTRLVELRIDALGLHLKGDDLRTGRPYPNKKYDVGHRRIGRKHVDGILLASRTGRRILKCKRVGRLLRNIWQRTKSSIRFWMKILAQPAMT